MISKFRKQLRKELVENVSHQFTSNEKLYFLCGLFDEPIKKIIRELKRQEKK